jgi:hypothetical protein
VKYLFSVVEISQHSEIELCIAFLEYIEKNNYMFIIEVAQKRNFTKVNAKLNFIQIFANFISWKFDNLLYSVLSQKF